MGIITSLTRMWLTRTVQPFTFGVEFVKILFVDFLN